MAMICVSFVTGVVDTGAGACAASARRSFNMIVACALGVGPARIVMSQSKVIFRHAGSPNAVRYAVSAAIASLRWVISPSSANAPLSAMSRTANRSAGCHWAATRIRASRMNAGANTKDSGVS